MFFIVHLHIVGICGTFMGGVARLALEAGHRVTGCDAAVYPPMSDQLRAAGIDLIEGFSPDQMSLAPDLYVIGNVVSRGNPLFEAILREGKPFVSGPAWLAEHILRGRHVLAVAGTHGKTTTSSLLAWILDQAGLQPGFLIGGVPLGLGVSARLGGGRYFVIEADEYDTALFDKRSKFVHYLPSTLILNNLEFDHADIFADLAAIETQFHHLLRCVPDIGRVVVNADYPALDRVLARGIWSAVERFGTGARWDWDRAVASPDSLGLRLDGQIVGTTTWTLAGDHNRSNAVAAIAAAEHVGVLPQTALQALSQFPGVTRRLQVLGTVNGVTVYDDFAHHPTAIEVTLQALRQRIGNGRILAVFEPRSQTMRLGTMQGKLAPALKDADAVFCHAPRQGKMALGWDAGKALAALGEKAHVCEDVDALVRAVIGISRPGDHVLVMSNGGFGGIHQKLLDALGAVHH
jgi:UDP-N-acetylmuramate: L-alanyl-gamma-D-glutamyl-meso-diaminopimelate ligase